MENVNTIILEVINDPKTHISIIEKTEDDCRFLHDKYYGFIQEPVFISLILHSKTDLLLKRFLSALVISVESQEITNLVFSMLIKQKGDYRESILIGLAHCPLSYYQLVSLNQLNIEEALYQLIRLYFCHDCFTRFDLQEIFRPWQHKLSQHMYNSLMCCCDAQNTKKRNDFIELLAIMI